VFATCTGTWEEGEKRFEPLELHPASLPVSIDFILRNPRDGFL
jgi:hypothetical protein